MVELDSLGKADTVRNYVGGDWVTPESDDELVTTNPTTGEELGRVPFSSTNDVDDAVRTANEAFEDWSGRPVEERIQPLFELKSLLEENLDELAEILVQDHGKTRAEARGELRRGIENVEVACGIPSMMQSGTLLNAAPEIDESAVRKPLGTFAAITPFNFPGMIPLWFLPYAVATGNSFILKPSEQDPLVTQKLFELIDEAGFPDGVVQLVNGGKDTVNDLIDHDGIEGISFVGSTPIAKLVYERAAANGKRVQAQGGAKNHIVVTETADLEFAAEKTVSSACACAGERCLANDVVLVEESVYDEFADLVVAEAEAQTVGYGLDDGTDIGSLISEEHETTVRNYIQTGIEEGATMLRDGRDVDVDGYEEGNFVGPTVFGDVTEDMVISQEEIFGPVLALDAVESVDAAIERMNASQFGNAASLFTGSGADAQKFRHQAEIGNIGVNVGTSAPMAFFHFGGWKDSFFGDLHAQGEDMIQFYTDKAIYIERWPDA
ncbi:methylmalonate-semialdehyde dehydrogenase (plasmid) [Natrialba magadii ATCC 43099]|uniref:methylmalonate-semialdehyde dehydrogenase (CoA acylating) n=1 Tax=Natrialba magadii (strain ATCC 43099 / DSM 3394 / CCM 3739 / CIP 104546 / IAM 13178 / JCM 8861 / NBRC 102185 / NCIMB 2190 / MS3) TaxID=547559 RepID=D3T133_NATMM|nr:CoA-acylating methylmalonate-semialdehyde dehydrogenase [Natrialba magadii]ADD07292.1 methylmalonate-semialdehyde dehydrogenase [Natrialba magadii ATCC 43099]ELY32720.1 methylmalonate-semialdehyde dehydrogenase [Natrialba magadii ATCC 43099]